MTRLLFVSALLFLTACSGPTADDVHGVSTDPNAATGFITENGAVPDTAEDSRDDGVMRDADGRPFGYAFLGQPLPSVEAPLLAGGTFRTSDIEQWTVLKVWGIWCGDCRRDSPFVAELAAAIAADDELDFQSIHTPPNARRADEAFGDYGSVEAYFGEEGYSFPVALDSDASIRDALQIAWTPSYLLVGPDGRVRGFRTDLSVAGDDPVAAFLEDIAETRAEVDQAALTVPRIGPDGAMQLVGTTPFTRSSLAAAFPGLDIRGGTEIAEGEEVPVFHVAVRGDVLSNAPLFSIEPNWERGHVYAVSTRSTRVEGPRGAEIGRTTYADLDDAARGSCEAGADGYSEMIMCTTAGATGQFTYVFTAPDGFDGVFPEAAPADRERGVLVEMRYLPPLPTY